MTSVKPIGKTFEAELQAAGLLGLPFTWRDNGEMDLSGLTQTQRDAVLAVYAAHNPVKVSDSQIVRIKEGILSHLDKRARADGYLSFSHAAMFADENDVPALQAASRSYRKWAARVWQHVFTETAKMRNGARPLLDVNALILELPGKDA